MRELTINFNGQDYIAIYNEQSGYYEIDLQAPLTGGIYNADVNFVNSINETYNDNLPVQILAKEEIKIDTNKVFMWIFDYKDFYRKLERSYFWCRKEKGRKGCY